MILAEFIHLDTYGIIKMIVFDIARARECMRPPVSRDPAVDTPPAATNHSILTGTILLGGYNGQEIVYRQPVFRGDRTTATRSVFASGRNLKRRPDNRQVHRARQGLRFRGDVVGRSEPGSY